MGARECRRVKKRTYTECAQIPIVMIDFLDIMSHSHEKIKFAAELKGPKGKQAICGFSFTFIKVRAIFNDHVFNASYRYKSTLSHVTLYMKVR